MNKVSLIPNILKGCTWISGVKQSVHIHLLYADPSSKNIDLHLSASIVYLNYF